MFCTLQTLNVHDTLVTQLR